MSRSGTITPARVRQDRPDVGESIEACERALFAGDAGLATGEALAVALQTAMALGRPALIGHYRDRLQRAGAGEGAAAGSPRLAMLLQHADLIGARPAEARAGHLEALTATGLSVEEILLATQIIGFVHFQARLLAGLELLGETP